MAKLELRNVVKRFGDVIVCNGVNLDVEEGQMICLIGASGAGKSTLLRCINLLEHTEDGEIFLDGEDISIPGLDPQAARKKIGMVFQNFNLFPHMTAFENAMLAPRRVYRKSRLDLEKDIRSLFSRFGLSDRMENYPDQLSGGQQQRVAIIRALAMRPEVMLFDEITSALDPQLVGEVLDVLLQLKNQGMTMVLATHEMQFARHAADKICFLKDGKIIEDLHGETYLPWDFSITKNVISILFTALLMFVLFRGLAQSYQKNGMIASGMGRFLEPIVLYVRDEIAIPNIGEKHHRRFMGYLLTLFFFIWFLNLLGLTPLGINVTGNIAITFCLAMITFVITTLVGKKYYWKHIFWMPGVPWPMKIILAPIELLGMIIKPFSLLIRLYANIQAGHIVLMSLIGLMFIFKSWLGSTLSFGLAFAISLIEILVALLQAYIFTMLSALYFGFASEEH